MKGLNIRHLLIVSLGFNEYLHEEIDRIYDKRRWEYYETFKKSGFYDDMIIQSFTTIKEEKMKKVAGIVEWCYNHNDFTLIHQLINKGYKNVVRYYQQNKHRLDVQEFTQYISKKSKRMLFDISELELFMHNIILMYLSYIDKLDINRLFSTPYGLKVMEGIKHLFIDIGPKILTREEINKSETLKKKLYSFIEETLKLDLNKQIPDVVDNLFDYVIDLGVREKLSGKGLKPESTSIDVISEIRSDLFDNDIYKYIGGYSSVLRFTELNYADLLNAKISKEDLLIYAHNALERKEGNNYTDEEIQQFFIGSIFIHSLIIHYKMQKEVLIDDSNEAWYVDVQNRETLLNNKEKFYEKMRKNLEAEVKKEKELKENLEVKFKSLEKELERLQNEVSSFKEDKEELAGLRTFVYEQKQVDFEADMPTIEEAVNVLRTKKIIMAGGHPNMQRKLKEWLPELETISTDVLGKNFSFLNKYDVIYFYPNYANHSFYQKIKAAIKNSQTELVYLPDKDNIEHILIEMSEKI